MRWTVSESYPFVKNKVAATSSKCGRLSRRRHRFRRKSTTIHFSTRALCFLVLITSTDHCHGFQISSTSHLKHRHQELLYRHHDCESCESRFQQHQQPEVPSFTAAIAKTRSLPASRTSLRLSRTSALVYGTSKFSARPGTYLLIPCVAAFVGWFTNWLAVQMIFYPIEFRGIPLYVRPECPMGLLGWQGIVPCKTRPMAEAMILMVTSELVTVEEMFARLDPKIVAELLAPVMPVVFEDAIQEVTPWKSRTMGSPGSLKSGLDSIQKGILQAYSVEFLQGLTVQMQSQMDKLLDLKNCVVTQMLKDRTVLGKLFRKCGDKELDFLTNSGLWFGFLLGLIQMAVALFWDNPWSLSIGGGIVGFATNWLALKWIFEPVDPVKVGPFVFQGKFLTRQTEVSAEFSKFFARNILTSRRLWNALLTDPTTRPALRQVFSQHFDQFVNEKTSGLFREKLKPETLDRALDKLVDHVPEELHQYTDETLKVESTLRPRMEGMTSKQFERVLHPIFEEDELTLILAGAFLGFCAGLVQQSLEMGALFIPNFMRRFLKRMYGMFRSIIQLAIGAKQLAVTRLSHSANA